MSVPAVPIVAPTVVSPLQRLELCLDRGWKAVLEQYPLFLWALAAGIVVYGYELFNFSLSIDEEISLAAGTDYIFTGARRWSPLFLRGLLFPDNLLPFFSPLYSLLLLSLTACILQRAMQFRGEQAVVFCILFTSFTQFAHQMEFLFQSPYVAFGHVLVALAFVAYLHLLRCKKLWSALLCIGLTVLATGIYQAFIFVIPVYFLMDVVRRMFDDAEMPLTPLTVLREAAICIALLAVSLFIYLVLTKFLLGAVVDNYLLGTVGWFKHPVSEVLRGVWHTILRHLSGSDYYGEQIFVLTALPLTLLLTVLVRRREYRLWGFGLLCCLTLAPFLQILCFGQTQASRTLLGQSALFAFIPALALRKVRVPKLITAGFVVVCVLMSSACVSRLFFQDTLRRQADVQLAQRVAASILQIDPAFDGDKDAVYVHGAAETPVLMPLARSEAFGSSFFNHDGGNTYRILLYMRTLGIANFRHAVKPEIEQRLPVIESMPVWPHPGSVRRVDGIVVVKMGQQPGYY